MKIDFKHKLTELTKYDPKLFDTMGEKIVKKVRSETQNGKDVNGANFKPYTPEYRERKLAGKFPRQTSKMVKPNLTLTGDMMVLDFQTHGTSRDGVVIGWASPKSAQKIRWNEDNGRKVRNKNAAFPFSKGAEKIYDDTMLKDADKKLKKQNERIEINIGSK